MSLSKRLRSLQNKIHVATVLYGVPFLVNRMGYLPFRSGHERSRDDSGYRLRSGTRFKVLVWIYH